MWIISHSHLAHCLPSFWLGFLLFENCQPTFGSLPSNGRWTRRRHSQFLTVCTTFFLLDRVLVLIQSDLICYPVFNWYHELSKEKSHGGRKNTNYKIRMTDRLWLISRRGIYWLSWDRNDITSETVGAVILPANDRMSGDRLSHVVTRICLMFGIICKKCLQKPSWKWLFRNWPLWLRYQWCSSISVWKFIKFFYHCHHVEWMKPSVYQKSINLPCHFPVSFHK